MQTSQKTFPLDLSKLEPKPGDIIVLKANLDAQTKLAFANAFNAFRHDNGLPPLALIVTQHQESVSMLSDADLAKAGLQRIKTTR